MPKPEIPTQRVMTIREVSQYLRIPLSTVYDLTRKGKIRGVKFGKHWRFLEEDILAYLHGELHLSPVSTLPHERRQHPRINARLPTALHLRFPEQRSPICGEVRNLGEGGVYFMPDRTAQGLVPEPCNVGDPVELLFELPGPEEISTRIEAQGRIVRQAEGERTAIGIKFKSLSTDVAEVIHEYVG